MKDEKEHPAEHFLILHAFILHPSIRHFMNGVARPPLFRRRAFPRCASPWHGQLSHEACTHADAAQPYEARRGQRLFAESSISFHERRCAVFRRRAFPRCARLPRRRGRCGILRRRSGVNHRATIARQTSPKVVAARAARSTTNGRSQRPQRNNPPASIFVLPT